ncbi:unnamed protein product [Prunus armeniaca]
MSAQSCLTCLVPVELPTGAFVYSSLFAWLSKAKILSHAYLIEELPHQSVLVVHSLSWLVNSQVEICLTLWIGRREAYGAQLHTG